MVQASSLGANKHKRGRLRYLGGHQPFWIRQPQPVTCLFAAHCGRIGEEDLCGVSIRKSAVDFERVFEVEKRLKKWPHFLKNKTMVQASSLGLNKHKRGRLRYLGRFPCESRSPPSLLVWTPDVRASGVFDFYISIMYVFCLLVWYHPEFYMNY